MNQTLADTVKRAEIALGTAGTQHAQERLKTVTQHVDELSFDALYRLIDPERAIHELEDTVSRGARRIALARNVVALAPLLLTWAALAFATVQYQQELVVHPNLVTQPFLILWQNGFGGTTFLNFATTALLDVLLLALILTLTIWTHQAESRAMSKTRGISNQLDDLMEQLALLVAQRTQLPTSAQPQDWVAAVQQVIDHAMHETANLVQANQQFIADAQQATQQASDETRTFITTAAARSEQVLQALYTANEQLMQRQMLPIVSELQDTVTQLHTELDAYHQSAIGLVNAVSQMGTAATTLASSSTAYTQIAANIDQQLQKIDASLAGFVQQVTGAAQDMQRSADAVQQLASQINSGMVNNIYAASQYLVQTEARLTLAAAALDRAAGKLDQAARFRNGLIGWVFGSSTQQPQPPTS